ncbi:MAG: transposase [Hyphomicrobiales bacterium]
MEIVSDRSAKSLAVFVEQAVEPGAIVITDAAPAYNKFGKAIKQ